MSNPNKAKGDRAERAVRDYLRANGFPTANAPAPDTPATPATSTPHPASLCR